MTKKYAYNWVQAWCQDNGWTDLFVERYCYWAFPPGSVLPQPIPLPVLRSLKQKNGLSPTEKGWYSSSVLVSIMAILTSHWLQCPLPLVFAFGFCAIVMAYLDDSPEIAA
jgi:hypothetical protein